MIIISAILLLFIIAILTTDTCEHQYSEATCDEPEICTLCEKSNGKPLGHNWEEADCFNPKTCLRCGITEGAKLEHQWEDATCIEPKTCALCGENEGEELGHNVTNWKTVQLPTCSEEGTKEGTCTRCSEAVTETIEKTDHKPGKWVTTEKAKIGKSGKKIKRCKNCNETVQEKTYSISNSEYKKNCKTYSYETLARNPGKNKGKHGKFYGKVIQVMESPLLTYTTYTLRVALNGDYDQVIYVTYWADEDDDHILDDDYVTLYGEIKGTKTYETVRGDSITIPYVDAEIVEIK